MYPFERLRYWLEPEWEREVGDDEAGDEFAVSEPVPASLDAPTDSMPERTRPAVVENADGVAEGEIGGGPPSYLEAEWDELTRRVIQQQLQLMQQQLQAWRS
ncbi:MAG: hypothetical protein KDA72_02890 [Planctomycetales bacterium]|nr:hypothetical protein [Planctomycetales bacterium]